jgi:uncharacterized protein (TIGR02646 family)
MIPVVPQPEPAHFDERVRQRGRDWLRAQGWSLNAPAPVPGDLPSYWRATNKDLWQAYRGICAYLSIYFDWALGAASTDHFVAKSADAGQAYEWANFRLSCLGANRQKNRFDDVLDPFEMAADTFELNPVNGEIAPSASLDENNPVKAMAKATIQRLGLNAEETKAMRARHVSDFLERHVTADYLRRHSPFVAYELSRLGLLGDDVNRALPVNT